MGWAPPAQVAPLIEKSFRDSFGEAPDAPNLEILDRHTYETIRRLIDAGVLKPSEDATRFHQSPAFADAKPDLRERRREEARKIFEEADRKMRMSSLLADGGFPVEALPSAREAVHAALRALSHTAGFDDHGEDALSLQDLQSRFVSPGLLPEGAIGLIARLKESASANGSTTEATAREIHGVAKQIYEHSQLAIGKAAFQ